MTFRRTAVRAERLTSMRIHRLTTPAIGPQVSPFAYRKALVRFREVWYEQPVPDRGADIVLCIQRPAPLNGVPAERFDTVAVDLSKEPESLLAAMSSGTRYEIRRATKDGVVSRQWSEVPESLLADLRSAYDRFARAKSVSTLNMRRLMAYRDQGRLHVTRADGADGLPLVWHAYLLVAGRARLMNSVSDVRNSEDPALRALGGRANRALHWSDMRYFKDLGADVYDLGGWYGGSDDDERRKIDDFKSGFGGDVAAGWNCEFAVTALGRAYLSARTLAGR